MAAVLRIRNVVKNYSGFRVLDNLSLTIEEGAIHAVIGPNGAGKTTLFNVLSGFSPAGSGSVLLADEEISHLDPAAIARRGMIRSFQINSIFPSMSVLDNVKISLQAKTALPARALAGAHATAVLDDPAREVLSSVGLDGERERVAGTLPYGRKRSLELGIALAQNPRVLLLDEPTAGMGVEDIESAIALIRRAAVGRTVVLVEHNLRVVADLCERITVMQLGRVLTEGTYDEVRVDDRVITAYLGGGHRA
jgi:branched-chain amino acid transport system ATP-binding protein